MSRAEAMLPGRTSGSVGRRIDLGSGAERLRGNSCLGEGEREGIEDSTIRSDSRDKAVEVPARNRLNASPRGCRMVQPATKTSSVMPRNISRVESSCLHHHYSNNPPHSFSRPHHTPPHPIVPPELLSASPTSSPRNDDVNGHVGRRYIRRYKQVNCGSSHRADGIHVDMNHLKKGEVK